MSSTRAAIRKGCHGERTIILLGRTAGPSSGHFTQHDALAHALGDLPMPVLYDLDLGHIPPQLAIINGALATVELTTTTATLVQHLI